MQVKRNNKQFTRFAMFSNENLKNKIEIENGIISKSISGECTWKVEYFVDIDFFVDNTIIQKKLF